MSVNHHSPSGQSLREMMKDNKWVLIWIATIVTLILLVNTYGVFFQGE